jgi:hypothetical protein
MNKPILKQHLLALSRAVTVDVYNDLQYCIARNVLVPPGFNRRRLDIWITIPRNYPLSAPGLSPNRIYLPKGLLCSNGEEPEDYHPDIGPDGWAWWCFERISWNPSRDDFITLIELLRATMTDQEKRRRKREKSWIEKLFSE